MATASTGVFADWLDFPGPSRPRPTMPRPALKLISEAQMQAAERRIPELAAKSGHAAYKLALATTGAVVVKTSKGELVERRADGSTKVLKELKPGKRVKVGAVLKRAKQDVAA